jgi:hypothetical protein
VKTTSHLDFLCTTVRTVNVAYCKYTLTQLYLYYRICGASEVFYYNNHHGGGRQTGSPRFKTGLTAAILHCTNCHGVGGAIAPPAQAEATIFIIRNNS